MSKVEVVFNLKEREKRGGLGNKGVGAGGEGGKDLNRWGNPTGGKDHESMLEYKILGLMPDSILDFAVLAGLDLGKGENICLSILQVMGSLDNIDEEMRHN